MCGSALIIMWNLTLHMSNYGNPHNADINMRQHTYRTYTQHRIDSLKNKNRLKPSQSQIKDLKKAEKP